MNIASGNDATARNTVMPAAREQLAKHLTPVDGFVGFATDLFATRRLERRATAAPSSSRSRS